MKKDSIKKLVGFTLGTIVLVGVAGIGGSIAAIANSGSLSQNKIMMSDVSDLETYEVKYYLPGSEGFYEASKKGFDEMSFKDQYDGLVHILGNGIIFYGKSGLSNDQDLLKKAEDLLKRVEQATTSDQLSSIVEENPTLLEYMSYIEQDYDIFNPSTPVTEDYNTKGEVLDLQDYDIDRLSSDKINDYYKNLRSKFDAMSFSDQKEGIISLLNESINEHINEDEPDSKELEAMCKELLTRIQEATTSDQLAKIVDEEVTLLNFLDVE